MRRFFQFLAVVCFFFVFLVMLPLMEVALNDVAASQASQPISQIEPVIGSIMPPHAQIAIYSDGYPYPCQANAPPTALVTKAIFIEPVQNSTVLNEMTNNLNAAIPASSMKTEPSRMIIII